MSVRAWGRGGAVRLAGACLAMAVLPVAAQVPAAPATLAVASLADGDLQTRLAASLGTKVGRHETSHFVIMHTQEEAWAGDLGGLLEDLYARFERVSASAGFAVHPPKNPLAWLCFGDADAFDQYESDFEREGPAAFKSFYSSRTDRVLLLRAGAGAAAPVSADDTRIAHELAHQMAYNTGLQTRGVMYPLWVSEGIAMLYESALLSPESFAADNPLRRQRLCEARAHHRLLPLERFVLMTRAPSGDGARNDFYAQAWGLANLMMRQHRAAFARYLAVLGQMEGGRRPEAALALEFRSAFGEPARLETAWQSYLAALNDRPLPSVPVAVSAPAHPQRPRG